MGSPISPIVASLYMEKSKIRVINTAEHPARVWKRYVDDTFVVTKTSHKVNLRKGHITIVKAITLKGLQKTAWVTGLITETELNLMIII